MYVHLLRLFLLFLYGFEFYQVDISLKIHTGIASLKFQLKKRKNYGYNAQMMLLIVNDKKKKKIEQVIL